MRDKGLPAVYGTSSQKTIKFLNSMGVVITEIKERVNPTTESKRNIEEKELPPRANLIASGNQLAL